MTSSRLDHHTTDTVDFIDDRQLSSLLDGSTPSPTRVDNILAKSLDKQPLSLDETAALLRTTDPETEQRIFDAARQLKRTVYGNRIVLFAPLYIGNHCVNECRYCAFKASNKEVVRRTLNHDDIAEQVTALEDRGHKRLIIVFGEHPAYSPEFIAQTTRAIYDVTSGHGEIRRLNINAAPLTVEGFRTVHEAGIGTYQVFMETYHHDTYARMHPAGTPKGDYLWRLDALDRAMQAGQDDVGIGALFGLYDWRFETLALVQHSLHLQARFGVGPHTISFPRLQPAQGVDGNWPHLVSDHDFKKLIAVLRLAVPYTGLILTARERPELRRQVMEFGVSQIDAGSRIELGGYTEVADAQQMNREQFMLGDIRSLDEVMGELVTDGYIPSFCTACYRLGRTGEHFMEFAVPGFIKRYCTPNALTTLQEYLVDYASDETRRTGEKLIKEELDKMPEGDIKNKLIERLTKIKTTNQRDLYF